MLHARLDLVLLNHPKAYAAGLHAMGLYAYAVMYAREQETDGFIPLGAVIAAWGGGQKSIKLARKLVAVGLFEETADGFSIRNYAKKNETKAVIEERRSAEAKRKAAYRRAVRESVPVGHRMGHLRASPVQGDSVSVSFSSSSLSSSDLSSDLLSDPSSLSGSAGAREAPPPPVSETREPPAPPRVDDPGAFLPGAWTMGLSSAVPGPKTRLSWSDVRALIAMAEAHSGGRRGQPLLDWIEATAAEFARAVDPRYGLTPRRCGTWLDAGRPTDHGRAAVGADGLVRPVAHNGRPLQGYDPAWLKDPPLASGPRFDENTPIPALPTLRRVQ